MRAEPGLLDVELNQVSRRAGWGDRRSHVPIPLQLASALIAAIRSGRLAPGAALPGSRPLAQQLGLHRNTVVAAFDELREQGWLETSRASHTRVTRTLPAETQATRVTRREDAPGFPLRPFHNSSRAFEAVGRDVLDFTGGLPDARLFPSQLLARAYRRALKLSSGRALAFGSPAGSLKLREQLARALAARRGVNAHVDELLITRGSQLALHLLSIALLRPGDVVAVESPGYPSAREAFTLLGAKLLPIAVDGEGLDVGALERALAKTAIRALYVTPHCHDPTTVTLSARRRLRLLELARRHRFAVLEADYDHEFQFEGAAVAPMASADPGGVVILVGTLSKAVAPGLRMGFVSAPRQLLSTLLAIRGQVDRQGDLGLENAVAELMEDGEVQRHALRARRVFHERRDVLAHALRTQLPDTLEFEVPRGGLALWARVDASVDVERWAEFARSEHGVRFFTGRQYMPNGRPSPFVRIGFGHLDARELVEAVKRMKAALGSSERRLRGVRRP
ncbi:MAG: PLP-dependent aminotransferase family protein [Archangium sp.]|nr:PLP-dependent aminotransferase family protein [Archangium sp.]